MPIKGYLHVSVSPALSVVMTMFARWRVIAAGENLNGRGTTWNPSTRTPCLFLSMSSHTPGVVSSVSMATSTKMGSWKGFWKLTDPTPDCPSVTKMSVAGSSVGSAPRPLTDHVHVPASSFVATIVPCSSWFNALGAYVTLNLPTPKGGKVTLGGATMKLRGLSGHDSVASTSSSSGFSMSRTTTPRLPPTSEVISGTSTGGASRASSLSAYQNSPSSADTNRTLPSVGPVSIGEYTKSYVFSDRASIRMVSAPSTPWPSR